MKNARYNNVDDNETARLLASIEVKEKVFTREQIDAAVETILEKIHDTPLQEARTTMTLHNNNQSKSIRK